MPFLLQKAPVAPLTERINEDDLYVQYKRLERQLEFLQVQEDYIKDEQKNLKKELVRAQVGGGCQRTCFGFYYLPQYGGKRKSLPFCVNSMSSGSVW